MSLDAFDGRINPFQDNVNSIRNHPGQIETAKLIRQFLEGSEIISKIKEHVQDPYSFRCIPQVHGATKDTLDHCSLVIEREINAVTDNPTVFPEEDDIVSAGNFHGQPLALILDFMAIAMAEMGSISERRIYKLISGSRDLPPFLVANPGLNSGLMIAQYTCASIVSQNKQLCTPASIDTIDSSNGQEDHVSMGANAATKLARVIENCFAIQGIELLNAAQALDFRGPLKSSQKIENLHASFRNEVSFLAADRNTSLDMKAALNFVKNSL
jgi:histidine ammonia-lyase